MQKHMSFLTDDGLSATTNYNDDGIGVGKRCHF